MTATEVSEILGLINAVHRTFLVTPDIVEGWTTILGSDEAGPVRAATLRLLRSSKFPPTPSEILDAVSETEIQAPDAESVLHEVLEAVRDRGWPDPPEGNDLSPIAMAVVSTVGWQTLCDCENWDAMRAHVMRIAATYRKRAIEARSMDGLPGGVPVPALEEVSRNRNALTRFFAAKVESDERAALKARYRLNEDDYRKMTGGAS